MSNHSLELIYLSLIIQDGQLEYCICCLYFFFGVFICLWPIFLYWIMIFLKIDMNHLFILAVCIYIYIHILGFWDNVSFWNSNCPWTHDCPTSSPSPKCWDYRHVHHIELFYQHLLSKLGWIQLREWHKILLQKLVHCFDFFC